MSYFFAIVMDHPDKPGDDIKADEKGACRNANERKAIDKIGASATLNTSTSLRLAQVFRLSSDEDRPTYDFRSSISLGEDLGEGV